MKLEKRGNTIIVSSNTMLCEFENSSGTLISMKSNESHLVFDGIIVDVGCDGDYLLKTLKFDSMLEKRTWEVPDIFPVSQSDMTGFVGFEGRDNELAARYEFYPLMLRLVYSFTSDALKVHAEITNISEQERWLNCLAFTVKLVSKSIFDFPASVPCGEFRSDKLEVNKPICTGLVTPCIHSELENGHFNLFFIDPDEKWSTGVWRYENGTAYTNIPALEVVLKPNETIYCGSLYFQLLADENPYICINRLYEDLGYHVSGSHVKNGIIYSCHPHGTMDSNFPLRYTLKEYAHYLIELKEIGIDHIWLLPVFLHPMDENPYHATDLSVIDPRYGTDEDVKFFCEKAHSLGMTVLFDYVPHGPSPDDAQAKLHPDWCSRRMDGSLQSEWNCVSFDYNQPEYQEYIVNLVCDQVRRFDVDGARIDCAMGGLSNWKPYNDNRPSNNSVRAGVNISKAVRDGFIKGGKRSFIIPENFNPIPCYYPYTDVFYGMNLYRVFFELEKLLYTDIAEYVRFLTSWLEKEYWSTPAGYKKMRFLGNHDTVSWVWQRARAVDCYSVGIAKALWAVLTFIDGMLMIYQGDEDPKLYLKENGVELKSYFKKLFTDRKTYIGNFERTTYLYTGTSAMAFIRHDDINKCLVLVNLSNDECIVGFGWANFDITNLLAGKAYFSKKDLTIPPYEYAILEL